MMDTGSNLPVSGGVLVAALIYASASVFVTGPLVGERTIENSNWQARCKNTVRQNITAQEPQQMTMPDLDCKSLLGWLGPQGQAVCRKHGNPTLELPLADQLQAHQRRAQEFERRRLEAKATQAGSACRCAVSVSLEKNRVSWGIYAGSLRLIAPFAVKGVESDLLTSLRAPHCSLKG